MGLFDSGSARQAAAFRYAVDRVNADPALLPNVRLVASIQRIPLQDSFQASKRGKACPFAYHSSAGRSNVNFNYVHTIIAIKDDLS